MYWRPTPNSHRKQRTRHKRLGTQLQMFTVCALISHMCVTWTRSLVFTVQLIWDCFRMGVVKADDVWCWILGKLTDSSIFRLDLPVYECQWSPASWAPFDIKCYLRLFHWRTRACLEDGCLSRCFTADCLMALPAGVSHMSSAGMSSHHFSGSVSRQPAGSHQFSSYERDRFPETAFPRQLSSTPSNWDGSVLEGVLNAGWKRMFSNDGCLTAAQKVGLTDRWQLQLKWECRMSVWFPALTVVVQQQIRSASYWTSHRWWVPDCV